jgi:hypothetical protein
VGIAGEDDLDAPDLGATNKSQGPEGQKPNGHAHAEGGPAPAGARRALARPAKPVLAADQSAALRDRLVAELDGLQSADTAASWAHRNLPAKNTLTAADAELVEAGFRAKLAAFGDERPADGLREDVQGRPGPQPGLPNLDGARPSAAATEEPGNGPARLIGKTIRLRDKDHRKFVSKQSCVVCGRTPSDPHHLRFAQPRALGRKVSDEFTVPVCRLHHGELHRHGDEAAWWTGVNIDPVPIALALWRSTHRDGAFSPASGATQLEVATSEEVSLQDRATAL